MRTSLPKKLTLSGTDNNGVRHRYTFDKDMNTKEGFFDFMEGLGFEIKEIEKRFMIQDYNNDTDEEKIIFLDMEDIVDQCWFYENKKYELDIFWGNKKVIILVRTNQKIKRDRRKKLVDTVEETSKWISDKQKEIRRRKKPKLKRVVVKSK